MEGIVMSKGISRCTAAVIAFGILAAFARADQQQETAKPCTALVGTWRITKGVYGGNEATFEPGRTSLKHVTPAQFTWLTYGSDGVVFRAAGGHYTLKGGTYEETPEY